MRQVPPITSFMLMLALAGVQGCTGSDQPGNPAAHFESLGAKVAVNGRGQVVTLDFTGARITDAALREVRALPSLTELRLQECRGLTDDRIQYLRGLENLNVIILSLNQQITDRGVAHLTAVPNLENLVLVGCSVTDEGVRHLSGLRSLKALNLRATYVTDEGLKHLKELPALEELYLQPTVFITEQHGFTGLAAGGTIPAEARPLITDAGLTHLHDCRSLRLLKIEGGLAKSFTEAEVKSLTQALPDCKISID